jgi:hypothetical protein
LEKYSKFSRGSFFNHLPEDDYTLCFQKISSARTYNICRLGNVLLHPVISLLLYSPKNRTAWSSFKVCKTGKIVARKLCWLCKWPCTKFHQPNFFQICLALLQRNNKCMVSSSPLSLIGHFYKNN